MNTTPTTDDRTFEQALEELERIVRDLEDGQTSLEDALARYEAGVCLLKQCYAQLNAAEQRILLLTGADGDGKPVTQVFPHLAAADGDRKPRRKKGSTEGLF